MRPRNVSVTKIKKTSSRAVDNSGYVEFSYCFTAISCAAAHFMTLNERTADCSTRPEMPRRKKCDNRKYRVRVYRRVQDYAAGGKALKSRQRNE